MDTAVTLTLNISLFLTKVGILACLEDYARYKFELWDRRY